jgi:hypothetical protein
MPGVRRSVFEAERGKHSRKVKRSLSDLKSDRPPGAVLYSEKLLGLRSECPACGEWEDSTGWLLCHEGDTSRWYVDFKCTGCRSRGPEWKLKLTPLIEEVLKAEWNRLMAAPSKPCTECGGDGKCSVCGGTGVDVGVAVLAGYEGDCGRCGGTGACPACGGPGEFKIR